MHSKTLMLLLLWILSGSVLLSSEVPSPPRALTYDLEVGIYPGANLDYAGFLGILYGQQSSFNKLDSVKAYPHLVGEAVIQVEMGAGERSLLKLYLHSELRAHDAWVDGEAVELQQEVVFYPRNYSSVATEVTLRLPEGLDGLHDVRVTYGGMFQPSYSVSPSNYMRIDQEGAYLRSFGYSLWYPVLLGPEAASESANFRRIVVRTEAPYRAVVTGQRVHQKEHEGGIISEWAVGERDHTVLQITVRPFLEKSEEGIYLYYLDDSRSEAVATDLLRMVERLDRYYVDHYGDPEAGDRAHVVELPNFASGISAGNTIGITSGQWRGFSLTDDDTGLERLVAHEMVHPYVRPDVAESSPLAALFVEGFPSYFHLPALQETLGDDWYRAYLERVEQGYMEKRETGRNRWGQDLPEEKPILEIGYEEIALYKDTFVLSDRVLLFLHDLRRRTDAAGFRALTRELMRASDLTPESFMDLIETFVPDCRGDLQTWLGTVDYPEHLQLRRHGDRRAGENAGRP